MSLTIDKIKSVIEKLPHSESRVPFTYHHDYLRETVDKFHFSSRSEVAQQNIGTELEIYATSLVYILENEYNVKSIFFELNEVDFEIVRQAYYILEIYLSKYE